MCLTLHTLGHQIAQAWFPNLTQGVYNYYYTNKAHQIYSMGKGNHCVCEIVSPTHGYPTLAYLNIHCKSHAIIQTQLILDLSISVQMPIVLYKFSSLLIQRRKSPLTSESIQTS